MQQEVTTALCVFTCVFAFSCCAYCTWIVQMASCQCQSDRYIIAMEKKTTTKPPRDISSHLKDTDIQVIIIWNLHFLKHNDIWATQFLIFGERSRICGT